MELRGEDAVAVLDAGEDLWCPGEAFASVACKVLRRLIPCDAASFNQVLLAKGITNFAVDPAEWDGPLRAQRTQIERLAHQHPLIDHYVKTGGAEPLRIGDVVDPQAWFQTELYRTAFEPLGIRWQVLLAVPSPADTINVVALSTRTDDFSDRDVAVLRALRPHLTLGCHTFADSPVDPETAIAGGWVVLTIDASRKVVASSGDAPLAPGDAVPDEIELTADDVAGLPDLTVVNFNGESWMMRFMRSGAAPWVLLAQRVSMRNAALLTLTKRQRQVLVAVADGSTNIEVARKLGIANATVRKHLEAIYRELGVRNRVEATALLTPQQQA